MKFEILLTKTKLGRGGVFRENGAQRPERGFKLPWRKAGLLKHLDAQVDLDQ